MTGDAPGAEVRGALADVEADPEAAERLGLERLAATGTAIVAGVRHGAGPYLRAGSGRVLDAWGRLDGADRAAVDADVARAASVAVERVVEELLALVRADPADQRATPLEVVRRLPREPTSVLRAVGVPEVERDEFDERTLPDDVYGLAPRTLADLGDPDLGPLHLAWGMAKATVLRARAARRA